MAGAKPWARPGLKGAGNTTVEAELRRFCQPSGGMRANSLRLGGEVKPIEGDALNGRYRYHSVTGE
jgi:hypothetical protein